MRSVFITPLILSVALVAQNSLPVDVYSDGHGVVTREDRSWEDGYRKRWQHDKIVRSTHGTNCTGSCSW